MSELRSFKYYKFDGLKIVEIETHDGGFRIVRDDGMTIDIHARRTDGYVSVDAHRGRLLVHPRAANVVYVTESQFSHEGAKE